MSDEPKLASQERPLNDKPFGSMTIGEKMNFIGKALVFLVSGGFIFPTMWID